MYYAAFQIQLAASALLGWWKKQNATGSELIEKTENISLQFTLVHVPGKPTNKPKLM
jgi:hypothetical protein